eukprot:CAMPEP_0206603454 /NCGR_PEP_ID=MMETSP0325_2-20121206/48416_1 /ASSEMBLY_ACC=CAM_ASM_000347 /TAXON_ID=2866 /ORGANISM="Crypthecodinium cohnii, Strain Seligo" /LENGTH=127 /DNA_ID=CAMNT_0054116983 /DNA_START=84 /DNA_END=467 /DNA_ORIENTATION=-
MSQSSRTPYDHLRYRYPETWKRLVKLMDETGAPVSVGAIGPSASRTSSGFRIEGSHMGPVPLIRPTSSASTSSLSRCRSDPIIERQKQQEKEAVHALRMQVSSRRNPFGGWYEGSKVLEKIGSGTAD